MVLKVRLFRGDRSCLLLILALALPLFSIGLGHRDLWDPDEPRTGEVAREIVKTGSWAVLHDNGARYVEKPPLLFWLVAAASLPAGRVTEFAVRLPSSLAALLGAVALFYLGRGLFGRRTGALAAVVLVTSQDYFMEARWGHPDMLWTLLLTCACLAFHRAYRSAGSRAWLAGFYLSMGLAMLTKGPAGLLLPMLAVLVFLAAVRDLAFLRHTGLGWGLPAACLPSTLWLLAYRAAAGEPFPLGAALERTGLRFTQGLHHQHPFPHILTSLALESLPWLLFLPGAVWHTFPRRQSAGDRDTVYVYSWIVVLFTIFAFSAEKRGVYLLPLLPLLALLVGRVWDMELMGWEPSPIARAILWPLLAGLALAAGASAVVLPRVEREWPRLEGPAAALAGAALLAVIAALLAHRLLGGGAALGVLSAGLVGCYLVIALVVLPALDNYKSARPFSERITATVGTAPLGIYPDLQDAYVFYTGRPIEVLPDRERLRAFLRSAPRTYCLMEQDQYDVERRALGIDLPILAQDRVGHRAMVLVAPTRPGPGAER